ncbi:hypothetical protein PICMEDRAFT_10946 [Pichia membranifaciens NRRL Y-2026]|uniref:LIM zinc-binding domain-containing protein n=1 Tax=Pichia membranifaciens NRRL Y-2026 TaxID=763406 RepID=A0A1E3NQP4_9ASCO|nr:hypothetical protein PICMEDRAFT_10946 [Pichia membranifaciens NRRL Y-2026]ODQ48018.1 hypothetical protein PICMEDRAFT_10946 [Pichia membranifaciens NRRL Y-2026]
MSSSSNFFKPAATPLDLDSLPDFMQSPNQQVKFHSAFPPLTTKVRVRGVMERAGFDVYKPEKDRSISSGTRSPRLNDLYHGDNGQFHPPNRLHSNRSSSSSQKSPNRVPLRSYSHNQMRTENTSSRSTTEYRSNASDNHEAGERFKNPSGKTRNFTTNPSNNSTPNLAHGFDKSTSSTHSPVDSSSSPSSEIKKKNSILSYARQRLNLHTAKQNQTVPTASPLQQNNYSSKEKTYPEPVVPNLTLSDTPRHTIDSDLEYNPTDRVKLEPTATLAYKSEAEGDFMSPPEDIWVEGSKRVHHGAADELYSRQVPQVNGPRPYYDSESDPNMEEHTDIPLNFGNNQHPGGVPSASQYAFTNPDIVVSQPDGQNIDVYADDSRSYTKLSAPEQSNSRSLVPGSPAKSFKSESSVESFDEKFMLHGNDKEEDYTGDLSQETLGGLGGLRKTIQSTESEGMLPVVPNMKNIYNQDNKRISTLGTNDMKIYNLQSFDSEDTDDQQELQVVNDNVVDFNQINEMSVIQEGESEDRKSSLDMNDPYRSNVPSEISKVLPDSSVARIPILTINRDSSSEDHDIASFKDAEQGDYDHEDGLFEAGKPSVAGFTGHSANIVDTPSSSLNPFLPDSETPQPKALNANGISDLINDIDNFGLASGGPNEEAEDYRDADVSGEHYDTSQQTMGSFEIPPRHFEIQQLQPHQHQHPHSHSSAASTSDTEAAHASHHPYASLSHNSNTPSFGSTPLQMSSGFTTPDKDINFEESKASFITAHKELYYPPGEGPCRKCGDIILDSEKKIWSKDNQLSGQWHRSCFGCHKCGSKFNKGSSCYVYGDQPYCERHFHELNGSLCWICNKGVEGECLQNEINEVFHIDCLKCVICGLNVEGDYFIFRDEVMCETDAKELMYQIEEAEKEYQGKDVEKMIKRRTRVLYL